MITVAKLTDIITLARTKNNRMRPKHIQAVFFDMDGVLYDSMPNHEYTWIESLKKYGIDFPPEQAYMHEGRTGFSTIQIAFQKYLNRPATQQEQEAVYALKTQIMNTCPPAPLMPGMQKLIQQLKTRNIQVFVVTGSRQPALVQKLKGHFGVDASHIVSGKDVQHGKPHPEPYLIAWERSGVNKANCLVIENSPMGIESAKAAGIYTIAVNTGKLEDDILLNAGANELYASTSELCEKWTE